jgi:hypothetical protein
MPRQDRLLETSVPRSTLVFTVRDGALRICGSTPLVTPLVTAFAPLVAPFVAPFAPLVTAVASDVAIIATGTAAAHGETKAQE